MQIPPPGAALLLNTMRDQIAQLRPPNSQQVAQLQAQTARKLQAMESDAGSLRGTQLDETA